MMRKLLQLLPTAVRSFAERIKRKFDMDARHKYLERTPVERILEHYRQGTDHPGRFLQGINSEEDLLIEIALFKTPDYEANVPSDNKETVAAYEWGGIVSTSGPSGRQYVFYPHMGEYLQKHEQRLPREIFEQLADHCWYDSWLRDSVAQKNSSST